jgi:hypothetical protein
MAGTPWSEVVQTLKLYRFRTSNRRCRTESNARQFWHQLALPSMKRARGEALEREGGLRSSYLKKQRLRARSPEMVAEVCEGP